MLDLPKRLLVGRPLSSSEMEHTLLPKRLALPVFSSDPLSSVAYATQEILVVLSLGGLAYLHYVPWVAAGVVVLLTVVTTSYRQTVRAYPNGGGAYIVAHENLGATAGLTAASALLIDYVLTVAVSVAAGVDAMVSARPAWAEHRVGLSLGFIAFITVMNLRGVKESGRFFAVPTYGFVAAVYLMLGVAVVQWIAGDLGKAESAGYVIEAHHSYAGLALVLLALRAFASGCTALTGVEAISNGVPAFKKPKSENAATTLLIMAFFSISMFIGVTALAMVTDVHYAESAHELVGFTGDTQRTVIAQIAATVFGDGSLLFYVIQAFTAGILVLAANTAYQDFPRLSSILAQDRYFPRQFHNRGDRLVFSNGIWILAGFASLLIVAFHAEVTRLIQLYIVGVFVSFTLSQLGMVRHWQKEERTNPDADRGAIFRSKLINGFGACFTGIVLVIVLYSKFTHGAYIVVIAMPVLFFAMRGVHAHYRRVAKELRLESTKPVLLTRNHAVVLVSNLHNPTMRAINYAKSIKPHTLQAVTVVVDETETQRLQAEWDASGIDVPLLQIHSPYREITRPVLEFVRKFPRSSPQDVVTVIIPEFVVGKWWEHLLHNQSALLFKGRLLFQPGVMVTSVPWHLSSSPEPEEAVRPDLNEPPARP